MNFKARVFIITGFGSGESKHYLSFFMWAVIKFFLKDQYEDKTLMEELLANSHLTCEMVRPGMLTNGPLTKGYKVLPKLYPGIKIRKISRRDVAHFLISEAEDQRMPGQYVSLTM